jgi:stage V sporulation protein B
MNDGKQGQQGGDRQENVARGGLSVLFAKAFFIVSGLVQQALLSRVLGMAGYGALSRVLAVTNIPNNLIVTASLQGVSRLTSQAGDAHPEALRAAMRTHVPLAFFAAGSLAIAAPWIASFQYAPQMVIPLVLMSLVLLAYGLYAPLVGALNGRRLFSKQASLDVLSATLRTIGLVGGGFVAIRLGVSSTAGACAGAVVAVALIFPFALTFIRSGKTQTGRASIEPAALAPSTYVKVLLPIALMQLGTNLLMQVDLTLASRYLGAAASVSNASQKEVDEWVGIYRACQLFAFLPYQLLMSLTQVLFPMVAKAHGENDAPSVRLFVERGARIAAIAGGLLVSILVAIPGPVMRLLYSGEFAERGASTLRVLALGQGSFALIGVASAVLTSLGRERSGAKLTLGALAVSGVMLSLWVPRHAFGAEMLYATAQVTSLVLLCTLVVAAILVHRAAGTFLKLATLARVLFASGVVIALGSLLPKLSFATTVLAASALSVLYIVLLLLMREVGKADAALLKGLVRRKSA